jgi:hypothetical protein
MADKVKLTLPMTDSKTPDWSIDARMFAKHVAQAPADSQRNELLAKRAMELAYERGRKEGIEEAAKVATKQAPVTQDWADAPIQDQAKRTATAIRQLLEVKG